MDGPQIMLLIQFLTIGSSNESILWKETEIPLQLPNIFVRCIYFIMPASHFGPSWHHILNFYTVWFFQPHISLFKESLVRKIRKEIFIRDNKNSLLPRYWFPYFIFQVPSFQGRYTQLTKVRSHAGSRATNFSNLLGLTDCDGLTDGRSTQIYFCWIITLKDGSFFRVFKKSRNFGVVCGDFSSGTGGRDKRTRLLLMHWPLTGIDKKRSRRSRGLFLSMRYSNKGYNLQQQGADRPLVY